MIAALFAMSLSVQRPDYPVTKKDDHVDVLHGIAVRDPYRWLEKPISEPDVKAWVDAQNKVTFDYLDKIPGRDRLLAALSERINYERFGVPVREAGKTFYQRNSGLQNQSVLYVIDREGAEPRTLLDPNTLSEDGTVALASYDITLKGDKMLYALSKAGSDWMTWHVRDVATGKDLPDVIEHSKFGNGMWDADGTGFYYLRYPEVEEGTTFVQSNTEPKIYHHKLGTPQSQDTLVFDLPESPDWFIFASLSEDRNLMYFSVSAPGDIYGRLYVKEMDKANSPVIKLFDEADADYSPIYREGDTVWVYTTKDAPTGKVMQVNFIRRIGPRTIIEATDDKLDSVTVVGGKLIATYMRDVVAAVKVFDKDGSNERELKLPGLGTVSGFSGKSDDKTAFYSYQDHITPPSIYQTDVEALRTTVFREPAIDFDSSKYEAKQVFVDSPDGTKVPIFVVHKKGITLDGSNPTMLYGYGGFNVSEQPYFSAIQTVWLDMGGVWCVANIRGGGEYGSEWHQAAIKTKRQNAYDDFIACAEWLVDNRYATPKKLGIMGGSNGGLLVGVAMIQRPELFAVALPAVGVMDMLRFNQFTIGKAWEADYGSPDNADEFFALLRISPYHTLRPGTAYPATLVTTADTDDRVVPAHSFKFAARLQEVHRGDAPVLIRIETSAGHGGGKPISKVLEEVRDIQAFTLHAMGEEIPEKIGD